MRLFSSFIRLIPDHHQQPNIDRVLVIPSIIENNKMRKLTTTAAAACVDGSRRALTMLYAVLLFASCSSTVILASAMEGTLLRSQQRHRPPPAAHDSKDENVSRRRLVSSAGAESLGATTTTTGMTSSTTVITANYRLTVVDRDVPWESFRTQLERVTTAHVQTALAHRNGDGRGGRFQLTTLRWQRAFLGMAAPHEASGNYDEAAVATSALAVPTTLVQWTVEAQITQQGQPPSLNGDDNNESPSAAAVIEAAIVDTSRLAQRFTADSILGIIQDVQVSSLARKDSEDDDDKRVPAVVRAWQSNPWWTLGPGIASILIAAGLAIAMMRQGRQDADGGRGNRRMGWDEDDKSSSMQRDAPTSTLDDTHVQDWSSESDEDDDDDKHHEESSLMQETGELLPPQPETSLLPVFL